MRKIENEIYTRQKAWQFIKYFNGILPDPDPILRAKGKDFSIYNELLFDSHVDACITSRFAGVLSKEYDIVIPSNRRVDKKALDFIKDNFKNIDVEQLIKSILNSIYFGFSVLEKVYSTDGDYIYLENIIEKPQEWFLFDENNNLLFKSYTLKTELVDLNKVELIQHNATYNNPYGERKLSRVFWPVSFKKGGIRFWVDFAEKFGSVFLYAKTNSEQKREEIAFALEQMIQNAVGVFESSDEIQQINVEKSGSSNLYNDLLEFCNSEISKSILGQTLTTDVGKHGTYSTAKVHFEVRKDIIESDLKFVKKHINRIIKKLIDLNFQVDNYPEFIFFEEDILDIDTIVKLKSLGLKFTKDFYIEKFNLIPEQFEVSDEPLNQNFSEFYNYFDENEYKDIIQEENTIDNFYKNTLTDFQNSFEPFLNDVLNAINNSENYDDAIMNLLKTLGKDRRNYYETIGKLLLTVGLLTQNQMQKIYNFSEKYIQDQIDFLKMKVPLNKDDYTKLYDKYKNYGFTVASYQEEDIISNILDKLIDTRQKGLDYKDFIQLINKDGLKVNDTVYFQNVRNAQMAAKYNMLIKHVDEYPYWQYVAIMDGHTRPQHAMLNGKVWPANSTVWNSIFPPNGFNCRCTVRALSRDMLNERNLKEEPDPKISGFRPDLFPDKGFDNNVGKDLNWIRDKQNEALREAKDLGIWKEKSIELKDLVKKEGLKKNELLLNIPEFDPKKYKDKEYTTNFINDFCKKYGFEDKEIDFTDYQGKIIKINYRELVRHIVEDIKPKGTTEKKIENEVLDRISRLKYINFVPEIIKDPDNVIANIYVKDTPTLKTKVSKAYIKKINDGGKDKFLVFAANYDREDPQYRNATLYIPFGVKGWIIK